MVCVFIENRTFDVMRTMEERNGDKADTVVTRATSKAMAGL